jgi:hypothetical protein
MQADAIDLVGKILTEIKDKLPYALSHYNGDAPISFTALWYISDSIQEANRFHVEFESKIFGSMKTSIRIATRNHDNSRSLQSGETATGINDFIWRLSECIMFVEEDKNDPEILNGICRDYEDKNRHYVSSKFHGDGGLSHDEWNTIIDEWKEALIEWRKYRNLFTDYSQNVFIEFERILIEYIKNYEDLFWKEFWKEMFDAVYNGYDVKVTEFQKYLIHNVVKSIIEYDDKPELRAQALQLLITRYKESDVRPISRVLYTECMSEALITTGIILKTWEVSEDTKKRMRETDLQTVLDVYY